MKGTRYYTEPIMKRRLDQYKFYGTTIVGEGGKIQIPYAARKALRISGSDRIIVFGTGKMIHLVKINEIDRFLQRIINNFTLHLRELRSYLRREKK